MSNQLLHPPLVLFLFSLSPFSYSLSILLFFLFLLTSSILSLCCIFLHRLFLSSLFYHSSFPSFELLFSLLPSILFVSFELLSLSSSPPLPPDHSLCQTMEAAESADCSLMDRDIMQVIYALAKAGHRQYVPEMVERMSYERGYVPGTQKHTNVVLLQCCLQSLWYENLTRQVHLSSWLICFEAYTICTCSCRCHEPVSESHHSGSGGHGFRHPENFPHIPHGWLQHRFPQPWQLLPKTLCQHGHGTPRHDIPSDIFNSP